MTSTNALVDIVQFFSEHIFQDLEADPGSVHPVLQVDAIRFLYTFRTQVCITFRLTLADIDFHFLFWQLTKPQLLSVLPHLVRHLGSNNYVCYTYAAISIERILFIRQGTQLL